MNEPFITKLLAYYKYDNYAGYDFLKSKGIEIKKSLKNMSEQYAKIIIQEENLNSTPELIKKIVDIFNRYRYGWQIDKSISKDCKVKYKIYTRKIMDIIEEL